MARMICFPASFLLLAVIGAAAFAQDRHSGAYMVPSKVYVGDRARLVLSLADIDANTRASLDPEQIPASPDIVIHHITLERHPGRQSGGSLLTIEFSAYTPGIIKLPPFTIAAQEFSDLAVEISSILTDDESAMVLSGSALPLAIPGTSLLMYGTISAVIVFTLLAVWALIWGRAQMHKWIAAWKRRRLLAAMTAVEKRLQRALSKGAAYREILDVLSGEFRGFLADFTGVNCRAMTAGEMGSLTEWEALSPASSGAFLGGFFTRCDTIRFSGGAINHTEIAAMLGDVHGFLAALNQAARRKTHDA